MLSLRLRLLLVLLSINLGVWLVVAMATIHNTQHEVEELFDAHLAQSARILLEVNEQFQELRPQHDEAFQALTHEHPYTQHLSFQIWKGDTPILHSRHLSHQRLTHTLGFSDLLIQEQRWRVYALAQPEHNLVVQVAEHTLMREELVRNISYSILLPLLASVPFTALLLWMAVSRGVAPLRAVAAEVKQRSPQQLSPVSMEQAPLEAKPLVVAINQLMARLKSALENERHFTADAAHELRTPLASLKVQAQVAERAQDPEVRHRALQQIITGVNRSTHLVEQLLTLARLDPEAAARKHRPCDLRAIAEETLATLANSAIQKVIDLSLHAADPFTVMGDTVALSVLIRNLVDNAIRYTHAGGVVEVHVQRRAGGVLLAVYDNGPGIPPEIWADVFKRFRRGNHAQESFGCGLGLSIVQRIAEQHQATIRLEPCPLGGLNIAVLFPPPPLLAEK